jgi:hypothetical protein
MNMARMNDVTIGFDPEATELINRFVEAVAQLTLDAAHPLHGLRCSECGVTLQRPPTSIATAATFWAEGDLCPFTKECEGTLADLMDEGDE